MMTTRQTYKFKLIVRVCALICIHLRPPELCLFYPVNKQLEMSLKVQSFPCELDFASMECSVTLSSSLRVESLFNFLTFRFLKSQIS